MKIKTKGKEVIYDERNGVILFVIKSDGLK